MSPRSRESSDDDDIDDALRECFKVDEPIAADTGESPSEESGQPAPVVDFGSVNDNEVVIETVCISTSQNETMFAIPEILVDGSDIPRLIEVVEETYTQTTETETATEDQTITTTTTETVSMFEIDSTSHAFDSIFLAHVPALPPSAEDVAKLQRAILEEQCKIEELNRKINESQARKDSLLREFKTLNDKLPKSIILTRTANETLGLSVSYETSKRGFLVTDVKPAGLVPEYNKSAVRPIKTGDVIREVNGVSGDKESMLRELKAARMVIQLLE